MPDLTNEQIEELRAFDTDTRFYAVIDELLRLRKVLANWDRAVNRDGTTITNELDMAFAAHLAEARRCCDMEQPPCPES